MRSGVRGTIGPIEMLARPPKMLIPRFGQRKWNCARGSSPCGGAVRSGPCWVERRPSLESSYASGETSITSLKPGCATWQW